MLKVGQRVTRTPKTFGVLSDTNFGYVLESRPMCGEVVFVHSEGRFHVVEFENASGEKIRETFDGVE